MRHLLAVPDAPADLGLRWAWLLLPLPAIWIARAYLRGAVMAADASRWLSVAGALHSTALVGALLILTRTSLPGVACAAAALTAGVAAETVVMLYARARIARLRTSTMERIGEQHAEPGRSWAT